MVTNLKKQFVMVVMVLVMLIAGAFGIVQAQRALPLHHTSSVHSTLAQAYIPYPWCPAPPYVC